MIGESTKLHELNNFSPNMIRIVRQEDEMDGACTTYGREYECTQVFGGKTKRKEH
jgi:hypothetical protein